MPDEEGTLTLGTISFQNFTANLAALDTKVTTDVISSPRIAVRENEEAEIAIGDTIPIPTYERNETTGMMEITGYQDEQLGTTLRVTPIINNDNSITLRIHPQIREDTDTAVGPDGERPIISTREVNTTFTVENGKTIVIGGLKSQNKTKTEKKVPFLGYIPGIGKLFSYKSDSDENRELLIFLTPNILQEDNNKNGQ
jgi:general secretion pathway protein D